MAEVTGDPPTTSAMSAETLYHRWLGWHALALRRTMTVVPVGIFFGLVLLWFAPWELAVVGGWDAAALTFLITVWPIIIRADGSQAEHLSTREDETRASAAALVVGASVASLLGAGFA